MLESAVHGGRNACNPRKRADCTRAMFSTGISTPAEIYLSDLAAWLAFLSHQRLFVYYLFCRVPCHLHLSRYRMRYVWHIHFWDLVRFFCSYQVYLQMDQERFCCVYRPHYVTSPLSLLSSLSVSGGLDCSSMVSCLIYFLKQSLLLFHCAYCGPFFFR